MSQFEFDRTYEHIRPAVIMAGMPKRSSKNPKDVNVLAARILAEATGDASKRKPGPEEEGKNPAAVALGRLGGLKGGKARAKKLSKERLSEIGKKAAQTRWKSQKKTTTQHEAVAKRKRRRTVILGPED